MPKEKNEFEEINKDCFENLSEENKLRLFQWIGDKKVADILKKFSKEEQFSKSPFYKNNIKWNGKNKEEPEIALVLDFWKNVVSNTDQLGHQFALLKLEQKFIKELGKYIDEPASMRVEDLIKKIDEVEDSKITPFYKALLKTILGSVTPNDHLDELYAAERKQKVQEEANNRAQKKQEQLLEKERKEKETLQKQNSSLLDNLKKANEAKKEAEKQLKELNEQLKKSEPRITELERKNEALQERLDRILDLLKDLPVGIPETVRVEDIEKTCSSIKEALDNHEYEAIKEKAIAVYILAERLLKEEE